MVGSIFEVVDRREGTSWVATRLAELKEKWKPVAIVADAGSADGALLPDLQRARVRTKQISLRDYAQACGAFYDTVLHGNASHHGEPVLDEAVDAAGQKHIGETAFYWTRKTLSRTFPRWWDALTLCTACSPRPAATAHPAPGAC